MSNKEQQVEALQQMQEKIAGLRARLQTLSAAAGEADGFQLMTAAELEQLSDVELNNRIGACAAEVAGLEARVEALGAAKPMARLGTVCIVLGFVVFLLVGLMFLLKYM